MQTHQPQRSKQLYGSRTVGDSVTQPSQLPETSFVPVITRRLSRPVLIWQDKRAASLGFDCERVFASPSVGEDPRAYSEESRVQWADRYGGVGTGTAGGSGRCATFGDLQTKGVGVTSLVAHDGDLHHSSGTQTALSALAETVFSGVFEAALPFGAVPTVAALLIQPAEEGGDPMTPPRALTIRPFVLRPAHFMRNAFNMEQRTAQGATGPGLSRDAYRVSQALGHFTRGLRASLDLPGTDDLTTIDTGLRELTRRLAWQFAASFAKRLPHGSVSCSNFSLAGEFIDYGMSRFVPAYRKPADALQDPWTESQRAIHTVKLLRQQLDKYHASLRGAKVVSADELEDSFASAMEQRLAVEMAKMAGLTEDLALACPQALLVDWLRAMRSIWHRGGRDPVAPRDPQVSEDPPAANPLRPDLSQILTASASHTEAEGMDRGLQPLLSDEHLRRRFIESSLAVREVLKQVVGGAEQALDLYIKSQATRKNAVLCPLERDSWYRIHIVTQMQEANFSTSTVESLMMSALRMAKYTLSDISPDFVGDSGLRQVVSMKEYSK